VSGILFYFVQAFACGALGHIKVSQDNEQLHYLTNAEPFQQPFCPTLLFTFYYPSHEKYCEGTCSIS
jgi:hypothetical protein